MDLTTNYMGLTLKNPLVASASPLTGDLDGIRRIEDAGAGALVLPSLFQEEIEDEAARQATWIGATENIWPESSSHFPDLADAPFGPHKYLELVRRASESSDIPIIASLNGITKEGWIEYASLIQQAGAKGLELNIYFIAADTSVSGAEVERRYLHIVRAVRSAVTIPLAVKLSPYFSSLGHMALAMQEAGADALVLFNRFYQPDIDLAALQVLTDLRLSDPTEIRLPLLWLAALHGRIRASVAASTGVESADQVIKYLLAGADVVMTTSSLLRHGPSHMAVLLAELRKWLEARDFASLAPIRGAMSQRSLRNPQAFERANYIKILQGYRNP